MRDPELQAEGSHDGAVTERRVINEREINE